MNKYLLIVLLYLFGSGSLFGQQYKYFPLVDSTASYWLMGCNFVIHGNTLVSLSSEYLIQGDTSIENFTYRKVWKYYSMDTPCIGLIREDSSKKVYFKSDTDTSVQGTAIFDFSGHVGDTIYVEQSMFILKSIDTIQIDDGSLRKRFHLDNGGYFGNDIWIEGIGSVFHGLILSDDCFHSNTSSCLYNVKKNGTAIYYSAPYCSRTIGINDLFNHPLEINLSPNPTHQFVFVDVLNYDEEFKIDIFTVTGQFVHHIPYTNKQLQVDMQTFSPGVYLFRFEDMSGNTITKRIIKQ